jgi:hypothetical protein
VFNNPPCGNNHRLNHLHRLTLSRPLLAHRKWVLVVWALDQQERGQIHLLANHHLVIRHLVSLRNPINNKLTIHLVIFKSKPRRDFEKKMNI